jgi:hypothetical protein
MAEDYDAGVQLGEVIGRDMIAVPVSGDVQLTVVGAPSYFARYPEPAQPRDLVAHECIAWHPVPGTPAYRWGFTDARRDFSVATPIGVLTTDGALLVRLDRAGVGPVAVSAPSRAHSRSCQSAHPANGRGPRCGCTEALDILACNDFRQSGRPDSNRRRPAWEADRSTVPYPATERYSMVVPPAHHASRTVRPDRKTDLVDPRWTPRRWTAEHGWHTAQTVCPFTVTYAQAVASDAAVAEVRNPRVSDLASGLLRRARPTKGSLLHRLHPLTSPRPHCSPVQVITRA